MGIRLASHRLESGMILFGALRASLATAALLTATSVAYSGDGLFSFFVNFASGRLEIREHDPVSGQVIGARDFVDSGGMASPWSFAWHRDKFVSLITNVTGQRGLIGINPASGVGSLVGWGGVNAMSTGFLDVNPSTGEILCINHETFNQGRLYSVNSLTGQMTAGAWLHGDTTYVDSFCVTPAGRGFGTQNLELITFDPATGLSVRLGGLTAPPGVQFCLELACGSDGRIVGLMSDPTPPYAMTGLYTIDAAALTATPLALMPGHVLSALGVAFAPDKAGTTYCQSKQNSLGCRPFIAAHGFPSITADQGFAIACNWVRSNSIGTLLYGVGGPANVPFQGGTLCIAGPTRRTGILNSAGSPPGAPTCDGVWTVDFNAHLSQHQPQSLPPGTAVYAQWYGRDLGYPPPNDVTLSDALRFELLP